MKTKIDLHSPLPVVLSKKQAAELAHVSQRCIEMWIASGRLRATRAVPSGSSRVLIRAVDLLRLLGLDDEA